MIDKAEINGLSRPSKELPIEYKISRVIALGLATLIYAYTIIFWASYYQKLAIICFVVGSFMAFIVYPLLRREALLSRSLLVLGNNFLIAATGLFSGPEARFEYFYLCLICLPFVIFSLHEYRKIIANLLHPIGAFFVMVHWGYDSYPSVDMSVEKLELVRWLAQPALFIIILGYISYFAYVNYRRTLQLEKLNDELNTSHEILQEKSRKLAVATQFSALGELAGGVAHEINNPLAIISGYANNLIKMYRKDQSVDRERVMLLLKKINATVLRISKIVIGLRAISRDGEHSAPQVISTQEIINNVLAICFEKMRTGGIDISYHHDERKIFISCKSVQISQIILNLISNSYDAIQEQVEKRIWIEEAVENDFVNIKICDTGPGVPQEIVDKLFNPFVTTKIVGKGNGLGLSISRKLAIEHGGSLTYERQDHSTLFLLKIPLHHSE